MPRLFQRWSILVLAASLSLVPAFHAAPGKEPLAAVDDRWQHIQSPNFELYTHNSEPESRALLHDLELLRALVMGRFKFVERSRLEVTVYSFRRREDFVAYGTPAMAGGAPLGGFYLAHPDRAVINLAPVTDWSQAQPVVFHEYVHHLFRAADQEPAVWYGEGMAELLAAIREERGQMEIGRPHLARLMTLRTEKLLPLETLFAVGHDSPIYRSKTHTGIFYAQSWALLHYWYFGNSGFSKDAVARFVGVAGERKPPSAAELRALFRECFGIDYPEMQRRLDQYVITGSYRYGREAVPKIPTAASYLARPVSRDEIRVRLAELALRVNRSSMAKFLLLDAAAKGAKDPRVFEALGAEAMFEREEAKACELWEQALAAGSKNQAIYRELGLVESGAWLRDFEYHFRLPGEVVERVRGRLLRAIDFEPAQNAAYETLAWVEALAEEPVISNVNLIQRRFTTLRRQARTLVALALIRVHLGQPDEARALLADFDKLDPDDWAAQTAEIVLAKLENRLPGRTLAPRAGREVHVDLNMAATQERGQLKVPSIELPAAPADPPTGRPGSSTK